MEELQLLFFCECGTVCLAQFVWVQARYFGRDRSGKGPYIFPFVWVQVRYGGRERSGKELHVSPFVWVQARCGRTGGSDGGAVGSAGGGVPLGQQSAGAADQLSGAPATGLPAGCSAALLQRGARAPTAQHGSKTR